MKTPDVATEHPQEHPQERSAYQARTPEGQAKEADDAAAYVAGVFDAEQLAARARARYGLG